MSQKRNRPAISITVDPTTREWLEQTALDRSRPGAKVTPGNIVDELVARERQTQATEKGGRAIKK